MRPKTLSCLWRRSEGLRRVQGTGRAVVLFLPVAAILSMGLLLPPALEADQGSVILESSEQLFSVLAAINAAGYDTGLGLSAGDDTRAGVRAVLAKENIPVLPKIAAFYAAHKAGLGPGQNLGQYISLALLLGPPPDFKFTISEKDLPPDARDVAGLVPLLIAFYKEADLVDLWARVQTHSREQIERYSGPIRRNIQLTDAYLRFATGAYLGRTYTIYVDLLGAPDQVQARVYGENYYLVVTFSAQLKLDEIRHQYLHFLLDPLAVKYAADIEKSVALQAIARKAPALGADFKGDFSLLATECLIRATELRMDNAPAAEARTKLQDMTASGLILAPYFYDSLGKFEKQESSMSVYYKTMMDGIDPSAEIEKLAGVKFSLPPQPAAAVPVTSEQDRLLDEGDNDIYGGKYGEAKTAFEDVLHRFDSRNARALYGMAVTESNLRKPDLAREYFKKTIEAAHDARLATWSHIYLGRIADISGDRKEALAQYRAASLTAAAYPEAWRAVQQGLQAPFGATQ